MYERYVAYGLELLSAFRLPGMTSTEDPELPGLALELLTDAELDAVWSGSERAPVWRGRLGDGSELTIERGVSGDLLFANDERARFHLDQSRRSLRCAPRVLGLDWQRTLLTKVLSSISVMRGYEALHASAVDSPWGAVAIACPSGMGKTTLALELIGRGWPLLSDDVLALADTPEGVLAYPGTPHMNVAMSASADPRISEVGATLGILAGELWVAAKEMTPSARRVRVICLLERRAGLPLEARPLPPNPLPLTPYILGLPDDAGRERSRFELYADLVGTASLMRLTCDAGDSPAELADLIVGALAGASAPALAVGGHGDTAIG